MIEASVTQDTETNTTTIIRIEEREPQSYNLTTNSHTSLTMTLSQSDQYGRSGVFISGRADNIPALQEAIEMAMKRANSR